MGTGVLGAEAVVCLGVADWGRVMGVVAMARAISRDAIFPSLSGIPDF